MGDEPGISPGQWITVGKGRNVDAVVCRIYEDTGNCEIVYLDERDRAINEDAKWTGTHWEFASQEPTGGYADNYGRLQSFVSILRSGRRP